MPTLVQLSQEDSLATRQLESVVPAAQRVHTLLQVYRVGGVGSIHVTGDAHHACKVRISNTHPTSAPSQPTMLALVPVGFVQAHRRRRRVGDRHS